MLNTREIQHRRDLAKKQLDLANAPQMETLRAAWKLHGQFSPASRPMILIETGSFAQDIIPPLMRCQGEEARALEWQLHLNMVNHTLFGDDTIVKGYLPIARHSFFNAFGIKVRREQARDGGLGHQFIPAIRDLREDFDKLKPSRFGLDREAMLGEMEFKRELLGDILPVREVGSFLYSGPTMDIVHIMAMEDMFVAMCDQGELFHGMMARLATDYLAYFDMLEAENALLPTHDESPLCQGSYCFNNELPRETNGGRSRDVWGYMDSQESSGISPAMFAEFIAPYYRLISARYGLLSYGCCEAVHPIWDCFLSGLRNLRKVSISSWCDEEYMGERLRGRRIVYMRKPSPNLIGVGEGLDEEEVIRQTSKTVNAARGCHLELVQRDVYQIHNTPDKVRRYVELMRRCCDRHK